MDLTKQNFSTERKHMLHMVTEAAFVAIDCEFTFAFFQQTRQSQQENAARNIQQRYQQAREATNTFGIYEIGLTPVNINKAGNQFLTSPFNVALDPFCDRFSMEDIYRVFAISSSSLSLASDRTRKISLALENGVPYMSRPEASLMLQCWDRYPEPENEHIRDFINRVRRDLTSWHASLPAGQRPAEVPNFFIGSTASGPNPASMTPLTNFEIKCVVRLVKMEFSRYKVEELPERYLRVEICTKHAHQARRAQAKRIKFDVREQTGLRLIFEAMKGGQVFEQLVDDEINELYASQTRLDPRRETEVNDEEDLSEAVGGLTMVKYRSQPTPPVLVGHNLFQDLIFLYRTFYGTLPETFEAFCYAIHQVIPTFIDTKYVAFVENQGDERMSVVTGLPNAAKQMNRLVPKSIGERIIFHHRHEKYLNMGEQELYHEAGYDSMITARLLLLASHYMHDENWTQRTAPVSKNDPLIAIPASQGTELDFPDLTDPFWDQFKNKMYIHTTSEEGEVFDFDAIREGRQRISVTLP